MSNISVLLSSYNHGRYISQAIESVLNQTYGDLELIIVDDNSIDNSLEILKNFEKKDERIKLYFNKKNLGVSKTRNKLIKKATGKYIAFLDSDDVWYPKKLEEQLEILKNKEDLIVWAEGKVINSSGKFMGETFTEKHFATNKKKSGDIFTELIKGNFLLFSSLMMKRTAIEELKFNEKLKYLDDYQFEVDLASQHSFKFIKTPLVKYRIHGKNLIKSNFKILLNDEIKINNYFLKKYSQRLSKQFKWLLNLVIFEILSFKGKNNLAKRYLFQIIVKKPFNTLSILIFVLYFIQRNRKVFKKILFIIKLLKERKMFELKKLRKSLNSNSLRLIINLMGIKINI